MWKEVVVLAQLDDIKLVRKKVISDFTFFGSFLIALLPIVCRAERAYKLISSAKRTSDSVD